MKNHMDQTIAQLETTLAGLRALRGNVPGNNPVRRRTRRQSTTGGQTTTTSANDSTGSIQDQAQPVKRRRRSRKTATQTGNQ